MNGLHSDLISVHAIKQMESVLICEQTPCPCKKQDLSASGGPGPVSGRNNIMFFAEPVVSLESKGRAVLGLNELSVKFRWLVHYMLG